MEHSGPLVRDLSQSVSGLEGGPIIEYQSSCVAKLGFPFVLLARGHSHCSLDVGSWSERVVFGTQPTVMACSPVHPNMSYLCHPD